MRFYEILLRHPKSVIGMILLVTLFFGWHMRKVELNNSIEELLPENHPSVLQDKEIKQVFNSREMFWNVPRQPAVAWPAQVQLLIREARG